MKKAFLSVERMQALQNNLGWLDNYTTPKDEIHHVGPDINTETVVPTELLRELGEINKRREHLINLLMSF